MYDSSEFLRRRQHPQGRSGQYNDQNRYRQDDSKGKRRKDAKGKASQNKFVVVLASLAGMGVWYTTPVSDWLTTILVHQVPVEADVALGKAALLDFPYPPTYHPYWSPIVEQVGHELIATLEKSSSEVLREASASDLSSSLDDLLGNALSQNLRSPQLRQYKWDFGVVKADIVNAFALPGGIIRVTDKLLDTLSPTRGELAR